MLPVGNLREARSGADRAQSIVVTKCPDTLDLKEMNAIRNKIGARSHQQVYFSRISYDDKAVGIDSTIPLVELEGKSVTVLTGIAKPAYFVEFLKNFTQVKHLKFPDHYAFKDTDVEPFSKNEVILTTEKDYVRLKEFKLENLYYVGIKTAFIGEKLKLSISGSL